MIRMPSDPEEEDIRDLIFNQRVVCNERLITQIKDFDENSYRILEDSLSTLLVEDLISGSWTIEELSKKYGIHKKDIGGILLGVMKDPWVLESGYIARRTGRDEREGHKLKTRYSFIPIPPNARIFDPTLGFSLLGWSEFLCDVDKSHFISNSDEIANSYCEKIASFWEVSPEKINVMFEKRELRYLSTVYGPLPILESDEVYTSIKNRIAEDPDLLVNRFRLRKLDKEYRMYSQFLIQGCGTIPELQYLVVFLHDILASCEMLNDKSNFKRFTEINKALFSMICNIPIQTDELQEDFYKYPSHGITLTHRQRQDLIKIEKALKSPVLHERVSAVRQMRKGIVPPDIPILEIALKDTNLSVQMEALKVVQEGHFPFPLEKIYPIAIDSTERILRYAAVVCITSIASPEALEMLERVALNSPTDSAKRAVVGIARKNSDVANSFLYNIVVNTNDSNVRIAALKLINVNLHPEIIPILIKHLNESELSVRTASLSALVRVGTPEAYDALKERYSVESSVSLKNMLRQEIVKIDPKFQPTIQKKIKIQSEGQSTLVYRFDLEVERPQKHLEIISKGEVTEKTESISDRTYDSLSEDLDSDDIYIRQAAIDYLGKHFSPHFTPLITKGLENVFSVQHAALAIIREQNLAIPAESYLLMINSHRQITKETVRILGQIPIKGGPNLLKRIIFKYPGAYAKEATLALLSYPETETIPILKELFHEEDSEIKANSAQALGKIKSISATKELIEGLEDSRYIVRLSCLEALSNMECPNFREILEDQVNNDPSKRIRKVAADKLALLDQNAPSVPHVIKNIKPDASTTEKKIPSKIQNLSDVTDEYNLNGLKSRNFRTRISTIQQLTARKDSSVREQIIQILENDTSIGVQTAALNYFENFDDPLTFDLIINSFPKNKFEIRKDMVPIIAEKGGIKGLRFLEEHVDDSSWVVRSEICRAFQNHGNSSQNHVLEQLMLDSSKEVIFAAKKAMRIIKIREPKMPNDCVKRDQDYTQFDEEITEYFD